MEQGCVKKFKLIAKVSSKWRNFGHLLNQELDQLEAWADECRGINSRCWCKVMEFWIAEGDVEEYPVNWEGLIILLEDVEFSEVATDLKKALSSLAPVTPTKRAITRPKPSSPQDYADAPTLEGPGLLTSPISFLKTCGARRKQPVLFQRMRSRSIDLSELRDIIYTEVRSKYEAMS
jgi:hypothetical protein